METRRRIILYGKSVILGAAGASLRRHGDLEIVTLAPPLPTAEELGALSPDVIIFDLEAAHPDAALSLLRALPRLLLIGIDPATDQMLLWSGEHGNALAMDDLLRAIRALPEQGRGQASWAQGLAQARKWLAARATGWRMPSRRQRLALAAGAVGLCGVLLLVGSLMRPGPTAPLTATAAGGGLDLDLVLAFAAGTVLGGVLAGWWLRRGKRIGR